MLNLLQDICAGALRRRDVEFFRHLAECMEIFDRPGNLPKAARFQAEVLTAWECARVEMFMSVAKDIPVEQHRTHFAGMLPFVEDVRATLLNLGWMVMPNLDDRIKAERKADSQRKQIEDALKALGLPFARKRQAS